MKIFPAQENDFELIQEFVLENERFCLDLSSRLKKGRKNFFILTHKENCICKDDILAVFFVDKNLFFCFPLFYDDASPDWSNCEASDRNEVRTPKVTELRKAGLEDEIRSVLKSFLIERKIAFLSGERGGCEFLAEILRECGQLEIHRNFYNLMVLQNKPQKCDDELCPDDEIRRCTILDDDGLLDLQKNYLQEEVALPAQKIGEKDAAIFLRDILQNQLVFALFCDDEPVAKANTRAIGFKWIQIGGIYTLPLFRKNGFAHHLIYVLCERIQRANKIPSLFVNKKNLAAQNLYKKIGFKNYGEFENIYF